MVCYYHFLKNYPQFIVMCTVKVFGIVNKAEIDVFLEFCCFLTSPYGQHQNQIDYILCSQRWRSSIQSTKTRPGADCGSDHECLTAKFRLKLKKVGETTKPFRYDLNQIPYDYTVEVRNRFKRLDLIDREPDELWMVLIPVSCTMLQTSIHSSSGTLSIRSRPLNLFLTSTV